MLEKHKAKPSFKKNYKYPEISVPRPKKKATKNGRLCEKATMILQHLESLDFNRETFEIEPEQRFIKKSLEEIIEELEQEIAAD